jgi:hypothetical protein
MRSTYLRDSAKTRIDLWLRVLREWFSKEIKRFNSGSSEIFILSDEKLGHVEKFSISIHS